MRASRTIRSLALLWVLLGPLGPLGLAHDGVHPARSCAETDCAPAIPADRPGADVSLWGSCPVCDLLGIKAVDQDALPPPLVAADVGRAPDPTAAVEPRRPADVAERGRAPPPIS